MADSQEDRQGDYQRCGRSEIVRGVVVQKSGQQPLSYEDLGRQGQTGDDLQYGGEDEFPRGGAVDEPERTEAQAGNFVTCAARWGSAAPQDRTPRHREALNRGWAQRPSPRG